MSNVVSVARALADPTRWRIVRMAMEEALCVCELADILGMPQSTVSSHVQVIRKAGLLESEKCEKWTYFRIMPRFRKLFLTLEEHFPGMNEQCREDSRRLAERLTEREQSCCPRPKQLASKTRQSTRP